MNYKDYYGKTPIFNHDSFWNGDVRLLIDLGAEIHAAQDDGTTPFHLAALYGRVEAVKALLEAGADVNVKSGRLDWPGYLTPMVKTLLQDRLPYSLLLEICRILLDHGATITGRCQEYLASLHRASSGSSGGSQTRISCVARWRDWIVFTNFWCGACGINWDSDFRKMLRAIPRYFCLGNPLSEEDIAQAEVIIRSLGNSRDDGSLTIQLRAYAVTWVLLNPKVLPPLEADYLR